MWPHHHRLDISSHRGWLAGAVEDVTELIGGPSLMVGVDLVQDGASYDQGINCEGFWDDGAVDRGLGVRRRHCSGQ